MSIKIIALIIIMLLFYVVSIFDHIQKQKRIVDLLEDNNNTTKVLINELEKNLKLKKIMINAKDTKENYFKTLEKIEKELFKQ